MRVVLQDKVAIFFPGVTGRITLDSNRNAVVPVYILRIEKGGNFSLQGGVDNRV
jgi:hypothetical protein